VTTGAIKGKCECTISRCGRDGGKKRTRVLALQLLLSPRLLGLLEPVLPELNLLVGGVGVESVLQGLAVDDTVDDARGEGRVPDDLYATGWAKRKESRGEEGESG